MTSDLLGEKGAATSASGCYVGARFVFRSEGNRDNAIARAFSLTLTLRRSMRKVADADKDQTAREERRGRLI